MVSSLFVSDFPCPLFIRLSGYTPLCSVASAFAELQILHVLAQHSSTLLFASFQYFQRNDEIIGSFGLFLCANPQDLHSQSLLVLVHCFPHFHQQDSQARVTTFSIPFLLPRFISFQHHLGSYCVRQLHTCVILFLYSAGCFYSKKVSSFVIPAHLFVSSSPSLCLTVTS